MKYAYLFILMALCGCTEQERARNFGGTATQKLPPGTKLINATWKNDDLWLLTRPMGSNEAVEIYTLRESSSYGIWEGKVIIEESR